MNAEEGVVIIDRVGSGAWECEVADRIIHSAENKVMFAGGSGLS
jgi:hypothetical protein